MSEDVPGVVRYGSVSGFFVNFLADNSDVGNIPDQERLYGQVTLSPSVNVARWPTAVPPRFAAVSEVSCPVYNGWLCAPDTPDPGFGIDPPAHDVYIIASEQPDGEPDEIYWTARFQFDGLVQQPPPVTFFLQASGNIDLAQVVSTVVSPGQVNVLADPTLKLDKSVYDNYRATSNRTVISNVEPTPGPGETIFWIETNLTGDTVGLWIVT